MAPTQRYRRCALLAAAALLVAACGLIPEATFELASSSRLPRCLTPPAGLSRSDVSVTLSYYVSPLRRSATLTLYDAKRRKLATVSGTLRDTAPSTLKTPRPGFPSGYPAYEVLSANGTTDVLEHRAMEPVFYLTDDAAIWAELGVPANYRLERP
jgi:hypothetical protein